MRKSGAHLGQAVVVDQIRTVAVNQGTEGKAVFKAGIKTMKTAAINAKQKRAREREGDG